MMTAGIAEHLVQSNALGFGDAPWCYPFAANVIGVDGGFFENGRRDPLAREHAGKRAPADSAANDHQFRIVRIAVHMFRWLRGRSFGKSGCLNGSPGES